MDMTQFESWQLWLVAAAGIALIFAGYRIKKIAFFIIWFLLGYLIMGYIMPFINSSVPDIANNPLWQTLLPLAGGLLLALMGFTVEKLCLGALCFALVMMITMQYFGTEVQVMAAGGVVGIIAAGAAVMLMKPATIAATSVAGAYAATVALLALFPSADYGAIYWPALLGGSVIGLVFQFFTTKHVL